MKLYQVFIFCSFVIRVSESVCDPEVSVPVVIAVDRTNRQCFDFYAGQTILAGSVCVEVVKCCESTDPADCTCDANFHCLKVSYDLFSDGEGTWQFDGGLHVHVLRTETGTFDYPANPKGNPSPGCFPYQCSGLMSSTHSLKIPINGTDCCPECCSVCPTLFSQCSGDCCCWEEKCNYECSPINMTCPAENNRLFHIFAHAALKKVDSNGDVIDTQTGYSDGDRVTERGTWATFSNITIGCTKLADPCDPDLDDLPEGCETAFAKLSCIVSTTSVCECVKPDGTCDPLTTTSCSETVYTYPSFLGGTLGSQHCCEQSSCDPGAAIGSVCFFDIDSTTLDINYGLRTGDFSRWGWTTGIIDIVALTSAVPGSSITVSMELFAGAAHCEEYTPSGDSRYVGYFNITFLYGGLDQFDKPICSYAFEYMTNGTWRLQETHVYVGCSPVPVKSNGEVTVAPGQYGYTISDICIDAVSVTAMNAKAITAVTNGPKPCSDDDRCKVYVIAHASVCGTEDQCPPD